MQAAEDDGEQHRHRWQNFTNEFGELTTVKPLEEPTVIEEAIDVKDYDTDSFDDDSFGADAASTAATMATSTRRRRGLERWARPSAPPPTGRDDAARDRPFPSALSGVRRRTCRRRDKEIEAQSSLDIECEDADADGGGGGGGGSANANASDEEDDRRTRSPAAGASTRAALLIGLRSGTTAPIPSFCD